MEGVGARLGRSSTRYGPATVFTGPVRKWKKKWVHVSPNHHHHTHHHNNHHHHHYNSRHHASADTHSANGSAAATANGSSVSHLLLYKWTPISQSGTVNGNSDSEGLEKGSVKEDDQPPRRKFKYIPIAILEEPKNEVESVDAVNVDAVNVDEEAKPNPKNEVSDEKPDINDVPMEENEIGNQGMRQDLNETLDLTL